MDKIIWKGFELGSIFERSTALAFKKNQKDLSLSKVKNDETDIALISASRIGSGCVGYLKEKEVPADLISINKITFDDQWGFTYFQKERFVITGGHNAILEIKNSILENLVLRHLSCYSFLCLLINKITLKSGIFGYGYKINNRLDREIILLPCLEVTKDDNYVRKESYKYYTLAVDYIEMLMSQAKEIREKKTIRYYELERAKYERERAKYERERAKYESSYKKEKEVLTRKGFKLGELFERSNSHQISDSKKILDESPVYDKNHTIMNITASKNNNGCSGFLRDEGEVAKIKKKGFLTIASDAAYGGICFYQKDYFVSTGHSNLLTVKNNNLKNLLDSQITGYWFISKLITKALCNGAADRFFRSISSDFDREIILLPCLEVTNNGCYIWEENGRYFTLALEYISYVYLSGLVKYNQKLIEKYEYKY